MAERISASSSAAMTAPHTPSILKNRGRISTADTSKINVRAKEIRAETAPLFRAVKKEEA